MNMVGISGLIILALTSRAISAQASERASVNGARLYATYCADCHGKDGKGPGPLAQTRGITVPDLQLLATRNNSVFPLAQVEKLLSGTAQSPVVHGGIEMPLWGSVLTDGDSDRSARESRAHALARYLESVQK